MLQAENKKIRVGLLAPYCLYPTNSGGKKYIVLFFEYLQRIIPVELITTYAFSGHKNIHPILGRSRMRYANPFLYFRLKKFVYEKSVTHLIIEHPYFAWLGWLLKKNTGVLLVIQSHNIESVRFKNLGKIWWRLLQSYEGWAHRQADYNFFITTEDLQYAVNKHELETKKCHCITYGIEQELPPSTDEKLIAGRWLRQKYQLDKNENIILFVGSLGYAPNTEAVQIICQHINPILNASRDFTYKILICGDGLPQQLDALKDRPNIIFTGFVEDINVYFRGADIFINPIISGGGIKTKLVEALGNDLDVISTDIGAVGVNPISTNNKLIIVDNNNWKNFAEKIIAHAPQERIPDSFFEQFYWGNIAEKAAAILKGETN